MKSDASMYNSDGYKDKEILVRKVMARFIEKLFCYLGISLDHDRFKAVMYNEDSFHSDDEERAKCAFDAYAFLLCNSKNPLTNRIADTFFYILFGKAPDANISLKIVTAFFSYIDKPAIESAVAFHIDVFKILNQFDEGDRLIISLIFFNYTLAKKGIPTVFFSENELRLYETEKEQYLKSNSSSFYEFILSLILNKKRQDKDYYENLKELSLKDIYQVLKSDEQLIKKVFSIKHISVFGSFAKGMNRIDSDIDLLASFSLDLTSQEKMEAIVQFKKRYFMVFNRFVDVSEISEYLNDDFLKKVPYCKMIF